MGWEEGRGCIIYICIYIGCAQRFGEVPVCTEIHGPFGSNINVQTVLKFRNRFVVAKKQADYNTLSLTANYRVGREYKDRLGMNVRVKRS